jgi:hypothetical protein
MTARTPAALSHVFECRHVNGHGGAYHQHHAAHHLGRDLDSTISLLHNHKLSGEQGSSRILLLSNLKLTPSLPTAAIISAKSP